MLILKSRERSVLTSRLLDLTSDFIQKLLVRAVGQRLACSVLEMLLWELFESQR